jgi:hypothetical protein
MSRRSLLFVRREGIISTHGFTQTWKEGCGVGEADIVILIIVAEINVIIFIPRLKVIPLSPGLTKIFVNIRTTCRPIGSLYNLIEDLLGIANVRRTVWITSGNFFASKLLKLALQRFRGPLLCGITSQMLLPDTLPIGIPDGYDILNGLKQMLYFDNGELKSPPCHDDARCDATAK